MGRLLWIMLSAAGIFLGVLVVAPYGSGVLTYGAVAIPLLVGMVGLAFAVHRKSQRSPQRDFALGLLVATCLIAYFVLTTAGFRNEIAGREFDGEIIARNRSDNHQYPQLRIRDRRQEVLVLEGVSEPFFAVARPGDRITKAPGTSSAFLNNQPRRILDPSWIDALRFERP